MSAGMAAFAMPKTRSLTATIPTANNVASIIRERARCRTQERPLRTNTTMVGAIVNSASMLENRRAVHSFQYPLPKPVVTTTAASTNDDASGASTTPNARNMSTPGTSSNNSPGSLKRRIHAAPSNASALLLTNHPHAVTRGMPAGS